MKLNNIFPNYETFKNDVIDKLNLLFPNVEWLNAQNSYMSFQTLYGLLSLYYGDRDIRYDNAQTFINKFTFDLADVLPDIYAKQQVFINNELNRYLSSAQNRAIKISGTTNSNRNQNNNSKAANSTTPTNIIITSTAELNNLPITSANLSNIELIDNINSNNEQTNFKFIDDLIKNLTSDYSLRLKEFMNLIKNHFTFIDTSNVQKECNGLYESTRFRNGYYVSNVDYMGVENQEQIKLTNGKVQTNTTNIEKLQSAIGSLPDFDNIINTVNRNTNDIRVINNEQVVQNNNITANTLQIQNNTTAITALIEELKRAGLFSYVGVWKEGITYKLGQVVSDNGELYLCLVDQTTEPTSNSNVWQLLNFKIDMTNYFTKNEINQIVQDLQTRINEQQNKIEANTTEIDSTKAIVDDILARQTEQNDGIHTNKTNIANLQTLTQEHTTQITTLQTDLGDLGNQVVDVNNKFNDYYTKQQIEQQQQTQDNNITTNTNNIANINSHLEFNSDSFNIVDRTIKFSINHTKGNAYIQHNGGPWKQLAYTEQLNNYATTEQLNNQLIKSEVVDGSTKIIELGNNKVMIIAQANISNNKAANADLYDNLPQEVKDLRDINNIEWFEYNFVEQLSGGKQKLFTSAIGNVAAGVYKNRLYLRNENNIASYVGFLRFKVIYDKL